MCQAQIRSYILYIQNERFLWDSLLLASEEEKVAGEMTKSATLWTSPCLVAGMSRACRGRHGEVGTMEFELILFSLIN